MREIKAAVVIETTLRLSLREAVNGGLQDSVGAFVARSVNSLDHRVAVEFAGLVVAAKEDSGQRIIACRCIEISCLLTSARYCSLWW